MKIIKGLFYITVCFLVLSCSLIEQKSKVDTKSLTIFVNDNLSRTILPGSESYDISYYSIVATGPRGVTITESFALATGYTNNFELGEWKFKIDAYNSNNKKISSSSEKSITITSTTAPSITVTLYAEGTGSLRISFEWFDNSADTILVEGLERGTSAVISDSVDLSTKSNPFDYVNNSVTAGVYDITLTLKAGTNILNTVKDVLYVIDGVESYDSVMFDIVTEQNKFSEVGTTFSTKIEGETVSFAKVRVNENKKLDIYQETFSELIPISSPWIKDVSFTLTQEVINGRNAVIYDLPGKPNGISSISFLFISQDKGIAYCNDPDGGGEGPFYYSSSDPDDMNYFLINNNEAIIDFNIDSMNIGTYKLIHNLDSINMNLMSSNFLGGVTPDVDSRPYIPENVDMMAINYSRDSSSRIYTLESPQYPGFSIKYNFFSKYRGIAEYNIYGKSGITNFSGVAPFTFVPYIYNSWESYTPNNYLYYDIGKSPVEYRDDLLKRAFVLTDPNNSNKYKMIFTSSPSMGYSVNLLGYIPADDIVNYFSEVDILGADDFHYVFKGKVASETYNPDFLNFTAPDVNSLNTSELYENIYFKIPKDLSGSETLKFYNGNNVLGGLENLGIRIESFESYFAGLKPVSESFVSAVAMNNTGIPFTDLRLSFTNLLDYIYEGISYKGFGYMYDVDQAGGNTLITLESDDYGEGADYKGIPTGNYKFLYYGATGKGVFSYGNEATPIITTGIFEAVPTISDLTAKKAVPVTKTYSFLSSNVEINANGSITIDGESLNGSATGTYNLFDENYKGTNTVVLNVYIDDLTLKDFHWLVITPDNKLYIFNEIIDYLKNDKLPTTPFDSSNLN